MFKCGVNCIIEYNAYSFLFTQPPSDARTLDINSVIYTIDDAGTIRGTVPTKGSILTISNASKSISITILGKNGYELVYINTSNIFPINGTYVPIGGAPMNPGTYPLKNYYYRQGNYVQRMVITQFTSFPGTYYSPIGTTLLLSFNIVFNTTYYPSISLSVPFVGNNLEIEVTGDIDINIVATIGSDTIICTLAVQTDGILEKRYDSIIYYGSNSISDLWQNIIPRQLSNPILNIIPPTFPTTDAVIWIESSIITGTYTYRKRDTLLVRIQKYKFSFVCKWSEVMSINPNMFFYNMARDITTTYINTPIYYPSIFTYNAIIDKIGNISIEICVSILDPEPIYATVYANTHFCIKVDPFWKRTNKFALTSGLLEGITSINTTVELGESSVKQIIYLIDITQITCNIIRIQENTTHYVLDCIIHGRSNSITFTAIDSKWNGVCIYSNRSGMCE